MYYRYLRYATSVRVGKGGQGISEFRPFPNFGPPLPSVYRLYYTVFRSQFLVIFFGQVIS